MPIELSDYQISWAPYHRVLGEVISVWDRMETALQSVFVSVVTGESNQTIAIYHTARSTDLRIEMIRNVIKHSKVERSILDDLSLLLERVEKLSRTRNRIIHATWRVVFKEQSGEHVAIGPAVRISFIPDIDLANKVENAYFSGKDKHLYQKEIHRYIYKVERMNALCEQIQIEVNNALDILKPLYPGSATHTISLKQSGPEPPR